MYASGKNDTYRELSLHKLSQSDFLFTDEVSNIFFNEQDVKIVKCNATILELQ